MFGSKRPLEGVNVVELATFIAVPGCARILADMGSNVIKVEPPRGDPVRYTQSGEGRPIDPLEDTTFDLENANKRGIAINLKSEAGMKILLQLLERADILLTNWRPDALSRGGLDYDTLKARFPKLVYGNVTGYGETGLDRDLPGFDLTAFFARGGILGTQYQKGTVPPNIPPGVGDHQCGLALSAGVIAALFRARQTGRGEKVSVNLLHASIYMQGIMIQAAQYTHLGQVYPLDRRMIVNPFLVSYKTRDDRYIQICFPVYDDAYNKMMTAIGRTDLVDDPRYCKHADAVKTNKTPEVYDILWEAFSRKTLTEWKEILIKANLPFGAAQTWEEVLADEQAWAVDTFYRMKCDNGHDVVLIRPPIDMKESGLPPYRRGPRLGEHGSQILGELGYSEASIKELEAAKDVIIWRR